MPSTHIHVAVYLPREITVAEEYFISHTWSREFHAFKGNSILSEKSLAQEAGRIP